MRCDRGPESDGLPAPNCRVVRPSSEIPQSRTLATRLTASGGNSFVIPFAGSCTPTSYSRHFRKRPSGFPFRVRGGSRS